MFCEMHQVQYRSDGLVHEYTRDPVNYSQVIYRGSFESAGFFHTNTQNKIHERTSTIQVSSRGNSCFKSSATAMSNQDNEEKLFMLKMKT